MRNAFGIACAFDLPALYGVLTGGHFWHDPSTKTLIAPAMTNDNTACRIATRWNAVQYEPIPELEARWGALSPKLAALWREPLRAVLRLVLYEMRQTR
jgi:hypothetical protein